MTLKKPKTHRVRGFSKAEDFDEAIVDAKASEDPEGASEVERGEISRAQVESNRLREKSRQVGADVQKKKP